MSIDRLYTLKQLSEVSGYCESTLRELIHSGELAAVRRGKRGWFRVSPSAWAAWQQQHESIVKPQPIVVQLNPPKRVPTKPEPVDVSEFFRKGFKPPFVRSA